MAMKIPFVSTLNPNAPFFVPTVYVAAKGFSPEWWSVIQTSLRFWRVLDEGDVLPLTMKTTSWLKSWMGLADPEFGEEFLDFKEHVLELEIAPERTCTLITRMVGLKALCRSPLRKFMPICLDILLVFPNNNIFIGTIELSQLTLI